MIRVEVIIYRPVTLNRLYLWMSFLEGSLTIIISWRHLAAACSLKVPLKPARRPLTEPAVVETLPAVRKRKTDGERGSSLQTRQVTEETWWEDAAFLVSAAAGRTSVCMCGSLCVSCGAVLWAGRGAQPMLALHFREKTQPFAWKPEGEPQTHY